MAPLRLVPADGQDPERMQHDLRQAVEVRARSCGMPA
eukprot:SAG22_NODE_5152_length_1076_cov_1.258956_2_plen_36_part_01